MSTARSSNSAIKRLATSPVLELAERLGYLVRGALYAVMGLLALSIALRIGPGQTTDLPGSLVFLTHNPLGKVVLLVAAVGLAAYSVWGFVRAIYDPLHRGRDTSGYTERFGFLTSAISYAVIVVFALQLFLGSGTPTDSSTQKTISTLLTHPGGGPLTILLGLFTLGVGLGQFLEAYRATFAQDLKSAQMSASTRTRAVNLGRFGMAARGIIFLIIGWFILQAGLHHDATQAQGFGGAFLFLLAQPYGRWLLGFVALGFVALGLHSFACARWVRLMGSQAA
jgi:hypothetical protein